MPKSKRNKVVHLTQVKKKGKDHKVEMIDQVKQFVAQYKWVFIMDVDSVKSDELQSIRLSIKPNGRMFVGKNTIVSLAFKQMQTKSKRNFEQLTKNLNGHRALVFTNWECDQLIEQIEQGDQPELRKRLLGFASLEDKDIQFTPM